MLAVDPHVCQVRLLFWSLFFFRGTGPSEIYTLSLHDALPISSGGELRVVESPVPADHDGLGIGGDRKSTRLNSSHGSISYAVFCLKKKKDIPTHARETVTRLANPARRSGSRTPRLDSAPRRQL